MSFLCGFLMMVFAIKGHLILTVVFGFLGIASILGCQSTDDNEERNFDETDTQ